MLINLGCRCLSVPRGYFNNLKRGQDLWGFVMVK